MAAFIGWMTFAASVVNCPAYAACPRNGTDKERRESQTLSDRPLLIKEANISVMDPVTGKSYHVYVNLRKNIDVRVNGKKMPRLLRRSISSDVGNSVISDIKVRFSKDMIEELEIIIKVCIFDSHSQEHNKYIDKLYCCSIGDMSISFYPKNGGFMADLVHDDQLTIYRCPEFQSCN
ncbi:MAG: hypothetical protein D6694_13330 [Gammaproteobacteria bacterium]|nr:MAG: hypothetical protein D6694_13330 [Gammaproteobacteria bacterium]